MKSRIKKIIICAAALVFVTSGVSLAHDSNKRHHKSQRKAYGHHQVKKHHPSSSYKHFKPGKHYRNQHIAGYYCEDGFYHYYDKRDRGWESDHSKQRRHHRDRYNHKKGRRDYDTHYRRHAPREDVVYQVALKDPKIVFKVIKRDHR
jgi:hypothetical protein